MNETLNLTNFNPTDIQIEGGVESHSMSSKDFALGSIDLGDDMEDPQIQNILADIEKIEEFEESDIRFIKDIRIVKIEQEKKNIFSSRNVYVVQTKPFD